MIRPRRLLAALLTALLLAGLSLHASAAGLADMAAAPAAGTAMSDRDCEPCGDDDTDDAACAAVCTGAFAVLPTEAVGRAPLRPAFPMPAADAAQSRASPPKPSPPNSILD